MTGSPVDLIEQLPSRFRAEVAPSQSMRFRLRVGRTCRDVVVADRRCRIEAASGEPDAEIATNPATWRAIDAGQMSGVEAFALRRLNVRGSIEKALLFEPMFERPQAGGFRYALQRVSLGGIEISALVAGDEGADPLVLIHGLGATKASWLPIVAELARRHRVFAIDLPGFGSSSKPRGSYDAPWFADHVFRFLDMVGCEQAFVAGNSLGGRVAMEMAMLEPERVVGIACLCPASAFTRRPALGVVRVLRPELGFAATRLPRDWLKRNLQRLFADSSRIESEWYDAAIDDFLKYWRGFRGRLAFLAALRNVYLDEPEGENGFWRRLAQMKPPALYVYGRNDRVVTPRFARRVQRFLPSARVELWEDCGHVPQLEHPDRTTRLMLDFFADVRRAPKAG
jgi:pimeloyl-ACP methyl ester carboxylesterase/putative sterol carrier protein